MGRDTDFNPAEFDQPAPWENCLSRIECPRCGKFHGYCSDLAGKTEVKGENMNVSSYRSAGGGSFERLPYLEKLFKKPGQTVHGKIVAVRESRSPKFRGLFLDVKVNGTKYAKSIRFDPPYELDIICNALKSEDTDDWIGQSLTFVANRGKKGKTLFANIARPKGKP